MRTETIKIEVPKEILQSARRNGLNRRRLTETLKSFAILEITANLSKLDLKGAREISKDMKVKAWEKIKGNIKI